MGLRGPLSRGSQFKLHFYLGWRGDQGSSQNFHVTSFLKDYWLIIPRYETFNRNKMHGNTNATWNNAIKLQLKSTYVPRLFGKSSLFTKIKLKRPYLEAVALRFTFVWNVREIEDCAKISTEFFFPKTVY